MTRTYMVNEANGPSYITINTSGSDALEVSGQGVGRGRRETQGREGEGGGRGKKGGGCSGELVWLVWK